MRQDELYHYGVKGMKWKNHKYTKVSNGEYIYDLQKAKENFDRASKDQKQLKEFRRDYGVGYDYNRMPNYDPKSQRFLNKDSYKMRKDVHAYFPNDPEPGTYITKRQREAVRGRRNLALKRAVKYGGRAVTSFTKDTIERGRLKMKNKAIERKTKNGLQVKPPVTMTAKRKYNIGKDKVTTTAKNVKQAARTVKGIYDYNHDRLTPASYELLYGSSNSSSGVKRRKKKIEVTTHA